MKIALTAYESEQLETARSILKELTANLAGRGLLVTFGVTTGTPAEIVTCTCEADSDRRRRFPPSVFRR